MCKYTHACNNIGLKGGNEFEKMGGVPGRVLMEEKKERNTVINIQFQK